MAGRKSKLVGGVGSAGDITAAILVLMSSVGVQVILGALQNLW